ncbi:MAG TPA: c-type cytochrome biogenesis protein CcsB [Gammaproteobacteria bacterium]
MSLSQELVTPAMDERSLLRRLGLFDWIWALLVVAGALYAWNRFGGLMDSFEQVILPLSTLSLLLLGWLWKPARPLTLAVAALSILSVWLYGDDLALAEQRFFLKYILSSQSAIMWMSALYVMATAAYGLALLLRSEFTGKVATALTWSATTMGLVGLMVRWRESYLIGHDVGHIPVSNLYEVFILFATLTALLYLHYEKRYNSRALGVFVLTVISAAVGFILWYTFERGAHEIQPLVPALQSYWMKIHVPANFVGYGAFAIAAMVAIPMLVRTYVGTANARLVFWVVSAVLGVIVFIVQLLLHGVELAALGRAVLAGVITFVATAAIIWGLSRERIVAALPSTELMDDVMYKAIALGFAFFTVATVLGALWAAEAWGGYWSWDPKETWALIVWLNYAAWLHLRLTKGMRGAPLAWWAIVGLFVTLIAFLGVNMFFSGLHSYGKL